MMKLSTFIELRKNEILQEWDDFAQKLLNTQEKCEAFRLRGFAGEILFELVADMTTKQSQTQQFDKSQDMASAKALPDSAANIHGMMRRHEGMNVSEVVAEFRALRATVLRLWLPTLTNMSEELVDELIHLNESIDKAVADAIEGYEHH